MVANRAFLSSYARALACLGHDTWRVGYRAISGMVRVVLRSGSRQ